MNFSVVMSTYHRDQAEWLRIAVDSLIHQTVPPSEIVLVVDGPVPESLDAVIRIYEADPLFRVIRLKENTGLGNALKVAVEQASCELVARMDSDDISMPTRFEEQLALFEKNPALDIVGGNISEFVGDAENIVAYRNVPVDDAEIRDEMRVRCPFNHVSVMYKKSAVLHAGGYLDLFWNEDYYLWIRMQLAGAKFANTGTTLVNVRTGSDMYARRGGKRYFQSERFLQRYMLEHGMIGRITYAWNLTKRWIVQRCLPNRVRGWVFRNFARKKAKPE